MTLWRVRAQSLLTLFNVVMFAILYSLGNIVALASTMFLRGPCKQIKSMFDSKRVVATCIYLLAMIATLVVAIWVRVCAAVAGAVCCRLEHVSCALLRAERQREGHGCRRVDPSCHSVPRPDLVHRELHSVCADDDHQLFYWLL
jgi:hypothetical protein